MTTTNATTTNVNTTTTTTTTTTEGNGTVNARTPADIIRVHDTNNRVDGSHTVRVTFRDGTTFILRDIIRDVNMNGWTLVNRMSYRVIIRNVDGTTTTTEPRAILRWHESTSTIRELVARIIDANV